MFELYREENRDLELHTEGNRLLNKKGERVLLTGVNCASLEWLSAPEKLKSTVIHALDVWHANTMRSAFMRIFRWGLSCPGSIASPPGISGGGCMKIC